MGPMVSSCWLGCDRQCFRWGAQVQAGASHAEKGGSTAAEVNSVPSAHQVHGRATHTQTQTRARLQLVGLSSRTLLRRKLEALPASCIKHFPARQNANQSEPCGAHLSFKTRASRAMQDSGVVCCIQILSCESLVLVTAIHDQ